MLRVLIIMRCAESTCVYASSQKRTGKHSRTHLDVHDIVPRRRSGQRRPQYIAATAVPAEQGGVHLDAEVCAGLGSLPSESKHRRTVCLQIEGDKLDALGPEMMRQEVAAVDAQW